MKVFIGGSKVVNDLNIEFLRAIDEICSKGYQILIGDCFDTDKLVQKYLYNHGYTKVTVYVSGNKVRNNYGNFPIRYIEIPHDITGFEFYRQKDIAMSNDADFGLMLWDGISRGTLCNIRDLQRQGKEVNVISV